MKQKKIGDILYVFDQTPYVITQDTDAEVIKIQLEAVDGFKAVNNETVNAKIQGYNYFLFTVHKQEWADYVDNYTITVAATTHGTCTTDKTDADPGEEITITTTPAEGYELDTLTVMAGDTPVTVTNNKFTMPSANVTVTATFTEILYNITIAAASNGTVTTSPASSAAPGAEVTITATPAEGYELDTLTVMAGDTPVTVTNSKFTMPSANVTVTATFVSAGVVLNPKWYLNEVEITDPDIWVYTQDEYFLMLGDPSIGESVIWIGTSDTTGYIVCTAESSNENVITIEPVESEVGIRFNTQTVGTTTITATWPAQTVGGVLYAGGTASIVVNVM